MRLIARSLFFFGVGAVIGCATAPTTRSRLVECLTDPDRQALWCDGQAVPWPEARGYVCHPLEQHEEYVERCK